MPAPKGMRPEVVEALGLLRDAGLRARLRRECAGEWERVVFVNGGFTVHNNVAMAERALARYGVPATTPVTAQLRVSFKTAEAPTPPCERCESTNHLVEVCSTPPALEVVEFVEDRDPPPAKKASVKKAAKAPARKLKSVKLDDLAQALGKGKKVEASTTTVVQRTPDQRQADNNAKQTPRVYVEPKSGTTFDWSTVDLEASAAQVHRRMLHGLPDGIGFFYLPDVLALYGLDQDMTESCLRNPDRVEVRPETFHAIKRYPVLGFYKGDVNVILGFRDPAKPCVIAVYVHSMLEHDTHRVNHTGTGGARKLSGNPKNVKQLRQHLEARGAELMPNEQHTRATVKYKGEDLGQVSLVEGTARQTVETDWQRTQRRIHAIDQRAAKVG